MADRARQYRMRRRLDSVQETRERIIRAAFELHRDVGPAQATVKAIADRAGVERHTVQRHFPDLVELIRACTDFGMRTTGLPEPDHWHRLAEPTELLRVALDEMYRYWHRNEQLVANLTRDAATMPELVEGSASYREHLGRIWQRVLAPWRELPGQGGTRATAVAGTALGFTTWRALTIEHGLSDEDAVGAMVEAVSSVAGSARPIRSDPGSGLSGSSGPGTAGARGRRARSPCGATRRPGSGRR